MSDYGDNNVEMDGGNDYDDFAQEPDVSCRSWTVSRPDAKPNPMTHPVRSFYRSTRWRRAQMTERASATMRWAKLPA